MPARFLLLTAVTTLLSTISLSAQKSPDDSLVKVYLRRESSGAMLQSQYLPQVRVLETAEFPGAVIDDTGYIVCYVGEYSYDLGALHYSPMRIIVQTRNGHKHPGTFIGMDQRIQLAVVKAHDLKDHNIELGPSLMNEQLQFVRPQDWSRANPTFVKVNREPGLPEWEILLPGSSLPGSSHSWMGSLVLDGRSRLEGILTRPRAHKFSRKIDVYRILPIDVLRNSVGRIIKTGKDIEAGWLGISLDPGLSTARITAVSPGSPAAKAGLKIGDEIVKVGPRPLDDPRDLGWMIRWKGPGNELSLTVRRNQELQRLTAELSMIPKAPMLPVIELPEMWKKQRQTYEEMRLYYSTLPVPVNLGLGVHPLTPQLAEYFGAPDKMGLLVESVRPDSLAEKIGFQAGDVLIQINGRNVCSISEIRDILEKGSSNTFVVRFVRDHRIETKKVILQ